MKEWKAVSHGGALWAHEVINASTSTAASVSTVVSANTPNAH